MAKKVEGYIKLQIPAGKATPAPPVGPALGQHGVNIVQFTKEFNARTADQGDMIIPVVITVYADKSFSFVTKTPPAAVLLKKACGLKSASAAPNKTKVAKRADPHSGQPHRFCGHRRQAQQHLHHEAEAGSVRQLRPREKLLKKTCVSSPS